MLATAVAFDYLWSKTDGKWVSESVQEHFRAALSISFIVLRRIQLQHHWFAFLYLVAYPLTTTESMHEEVSMRYL